MSNNSSMDPSQILYLSATEARAMLSAHGIKYYANDGMLQAFRREGLNVRKIAGRWYVLREDVYRLINDTP